MLKLTQNKKILERCSVSSANAKWNCF